ncbi:MAG: GxxExxY protein [Ignavibacteriales bacterium]|nr:GxxExxY protein [Ignavibacteriales bacterium]
MTNEESNKISAVILDSAINVHKELGPGLLESVYEICLFKELRSRNLFVEKQVMLPVVFKGETLEADFRIDMLVEHEIIIELKAVELLLPVHDAQLLTYMKLAEKKLGFLINFNVPKLVDGFKRKVLNF